MNSPQNDEKNSEPAVRQKQKEMVPAWWGDLAFAAPVFLILLYGIAITILKRFDIKAAPWTLLFTINTMLFLWGAMGLVIVLRGEYRDRHKGIQRGFSAYALGFTLMVVNWLPLIFALTSTFFK